MRGDCMDMQLLYQFNSNLKKASDAALECRHSVKVPQISLHP